MKAIIPGLWEVDEIGEAVHCYVWEWQGGLTLIDTGMLREVLRPLGVFRVVWASVTDMPVDGRHNSKIDRQALRDRLERGRMRTQELEMA